MALPPIVPVSRKDAIVAMFLNTFMPPGSIQRSSTRQTVFNWYGDFPIRVGRSPVFDEALSAFCQLFLGQKYNNPNWIWESQVLYTSASAKISQCQSLLQMGSSSVEEELIGAAMAMASYELYDPSHGLYGWIVQVQLGSGLLEKRGPPTAEKPLDRNLYRRVRLFTMTDSFLRRKKTFFSLPAWQAASQTGDSYDELLNILFHIPTILQLCDEVVESHREIFSSALGDLLHQFYQTETQLFEWYARLQQNEPEPLYWVDSTPLSSRPLSEEEDPTLLGLFSGTVLFSNEYVFELVILYWFGSLMLYTSMAQVYQKVQLQVQFVGIEGLMQQADRSAAILSFLLRRDIECTASHFARLACQTVAFCLQPTAGAQGFQMMLPTLWAAQEYFRLRSAAHCYYWCQRVFGVMAKRGYGVGNVAANIYHLSAMCG
ncbi:hypothetical protein VTN77DRAFT_5398 [Rasamsonia byssochlamydoides]|uniref:uncharacterized protein n=1 Tax=Rasamsonia byssochlamydoides TaxID=89139 RepID=UPI0037428D58